jgi:transposase
MDESRFGLMTILRRRITIKGIKPIVKFQQSFENTYLYGAVCPKTGESFFFEFPRLNTFCFQIFIDELSMAFPNSLNILTLDNGSFHKTLSLKIPANIRFIFTPPYTPELNPIERVWLHFKSILADKSFFSIDLLSDFLISIISSFLPSLFSSLTSFPFFDFAANPPL